VASTDRVAVDAVGVAILKYLGSNQDVMQRRIFEHRQISRAAALGIGVQSPLEIELVAADEKSKGYRNKIEAILLNQ